MVDMQKLTHGVLHTKFWVVDQTHFYIGSANMDWRSLTQVCVPCLPPGPFLFDHMHGVLHSTIGSI